MSLRKTVRFLVLAVCALATFVATSQAAAPAKGRNLLGNPGFERGFPGADWMPASWDTSDAGIPTVFFGRDTMGAHGGQWCVNIANTSTVFPMAHNWSQTLIVGKEAWNQTARFSIWTRTNGLQGRAYVLIQAYRDSASKMSRVWGVDRDEARRRLNIKRLDDPSIDLGWDRLQFNEPQTDWVKREVSVYVPYGVNVIFVRAGIFGTGQLMLDDASLTLESAPPLAAAPKGNLFADPGFEAGGLDWEWVIPPFEGARVDLDSTYAHGGRYSMRVEKMRDGLSATRAGRQARPAVGLVQGRQPSRHRLPRGLRAHADRSQALARLRDARQHVRLDAAADRVRRPRRRADDLAVALHSGAVRRNRVARRCGARGDRAGVDATRASLVQGAPPEVAAGALNP